jgi:hypothetical protein
LSEIENQFCQRIDKVAQLANLFTRLKFVIAWPIMIIARYGGGLSVWWVLELEGYTDDMVMFGRRVRAFLDCMSVSTEGHQCLIALHNSEKHKNCSKKEEIIKTKIPALVVRSISSVNAVTHTPGLSIVD